MSNLTKETAEEIAARIAGSYSVNEQGEELILAGVHAGLHAESKDAHEACGGACAERFCHACLEAKLAETYELGRISAEEMIAHELERRAGVTYAQGDTDGSYLVEADLLKRLAKEFARGATEARKALDAKKKAAS